MTALIGLRSYLFRYRAYIIGGLSFIILANAVALIQPYLIRLAVDSLHIGLDPQVLLRYGLLIVLAGLLQAALQFFGRYIQSVAARRIEYELRGDLFKHFEKLEIDYFQHNKQGDLVARAINDLTAVRGLLGPGISNLMNTTVAFIATIAFMLSIDAWLTLYSASVLPLITVVFIVVARKI
jgi:ATP-binding cassette subfamily B multidrug efflux pump